MPCSVNFLYSQYVKSMLNIKCILSKNKCLLRILRGRHHTYFPKFGISFFRKSSCRNYKITVKILTILFYLIPANRFHIKIQTSYPARTDGQCAPCTYFFRLHRFAGSR